MSNLKGYQLVLLALVAVMFPRLLVAMGAPKIVNFLHFVFVPAVFVLVYPRILRQPYCLKLLSIMLALLGVITLSAFMNGARLLNITLDFLLLAEPFLLPNVLF
jgi:hypothetical protein